MGKKKLGEMLRERRLIDEATLRSALASQQETGERLGSTLLELDVINAGMLASLLAEQHEVEGIDPVNLTPTREARDLLSFEQAMALGVLPLWVMSETVAVAMADPGNQETVQQLEELTGRQIKRYVAPHTALYEAVKHTYKRRAWDEHAEQRLRRIVSSVRRRLDELEELLELPREQDRP